MEAIQILSRIQDFKGCLCPVPLIHSMKEVAAPLPSLSDDTIEHCLLQAEYNQFSNPQRNALPHIKCSFPPALPTCDQPFPPLAPSLFRRGLVLLFPPPIPSLFPLALPGFPPSSPPCVASLRRSRQRLRASLSDRLASFPRVLHFPPFPVHCLR